MNSEERKHFWNVLCSLEGKDYQSESDSLAQTIKMPRYLYRYRAVNLSTIEALQQNHMYFSIANYYDDPFDTLLHIDFNRIREEGRRVLSSDIIKHQINSLSSLLSKGTVDAVNTVLCNTDHEKIIDAMVDYLKHNVQMLLKNSLWTACFTESGDNETMWLKYADQYKGFCLVYDLQDSSSDLCGKYDRCADCVVNKAGVSLYPIYYSDEGYDATEFAKSLATVFMTQFVVNNGQLPVEIANVILSSVPSQMWRPERIALIKSKCHEYDREWRMILHGSSTPPVMKEWIPSGVILGLKISEQDKKIVCRSAQMAGVSHIYESFINDEYKIEHKEIFV